ncbi:MAG: tRNA (cytidine(56)-2'-O)-methyltransferase [Thermoplasmata archaeon]
MIAVLRLGHRIDRDKRVTTHVGLVARAFGADKIFITTRDEKLEDTLKKIVGKFGGNFEITTGVNYREMIKRWKGKIVHLTMYGEQIDSVLPKIRKSGDLLIIVGSEKVPREIYEYADYNIAVGNQPHSEVAALAVLLDRYFQGKELKKEFDGDIKIIPNKRGKTVTSNTKR